mmetsp:Transcript_16116/g.35411  ORF Transcript_16116/g.35411 Transcript_16116/m.35411 type:complete len:195 (-) Transcript_16116:454-1038(-)
MPRLAAVDFQQFGEREGEEADGIRSQASRTAGAALGLKVLASSDGDLKGLPPFSAVDEEGPVSDDTAASGAVSKFIADGIAASSLELKLIEDVIASSGPELKFIQDEIAAPGPELKFIEDEVAAPRSELKFDDEGNAASGSDPPLSLALTGALLKPLELAAVLTRLSRLGGSVHSALPLSKICCDSLGSSPIRL